MTSPFKYCRIMFSFVFAWILTIIPLPPSLQYFRPEWVMLFLIYWALREPRLVGVATGFCIGLFMDVLTGGVLGQYALSLSLIVYLTQLFKHRIRVFPFWYQAIVVLVLIGFGQLSLLMVQWLIGHPPASLKYWFSTIASLLVWLGMYRVFNCNERTFN